MSDVATFLAAYPRIHFACRRRSVQDPETGARASAHQARILEHLDLVDPVMVGELAEHMGVTASTMSITLKRLESAGFVVREREPTDRRVTNVRLTEVGARVRRVQALLDPDRVASLLGRVDPEQRGAAIYGLRLLADAAERQVQERRHPHGAEEEEW